MADSSDQRQGSAEQIVRQIDPQLLQKLRPEDRKRLLGIVEVAATSFRGPLPPPEMLAEYDRLIPQGADRLMRLLEVQTRTRQERESRLVDSQVTLPARGQWLGGALCVFFGAIGWNLALNGHDAVAGVLFGTTILGLITVFVLGRMPQATSTAPAVGKVKRSK